MPKLPRLSSTSEGQSPNKVQQRILKAVDCEVEPIQVPGTYTFGLLLVALAMLLVPLLYIGVLVVIGHALYWHAIYNQRLFVMMSPVLAAPLYVIPLIVGGMVLIFLIKPIFGGLQRQSKPQQLRREDEPFLYDYVDAICEAVQARRPKSIRVDLNANASAGFRGGIFSVLTGNLVLVIGLPLVAGMSVRQISGILAHEFGHFTQSTGMRLNYFVRVSNMWLERVILGRGRLDDWLDDRCDGWDIGAILFRIVRANIWLAKFLLLEILFFAHAISCFLTREMEYDADQYEARLVGVETFMKNTRQLPVLGVATSMAHSDLGQFYDEGRLADNFPALILSNVKRVPTKILDEIRKRMREHETGMFDTHPSDRDRVANVWELDRKGAMQIAGPRSDYPARVLFNDFEKLCRDSSIEYFQEVLGERFKKSEIHPIGDLLERREKEDLAQKALDRYFQTRVPIMQPLQVPEAADEAPANPKECLQRVRDCREEMLKHVENYKVLAKRFLKAEQTIVQTNEALALMDVGIRVKRGTFGLRLGTQKEAKEKFKRGRPAMQNLATSMMTFETAASDRLTAALQLLHLPQIQQRIENGDGLCFETRQVVPDLRFISDLMPEMPTMFIMYRRIMVLLIHSKGQQNNRSFIETAIKQMERLHDRLQSVQSRLHGKYYPLDHHQADLTLEQYALPHLPDKHAPGHLTFVAGELFERLAGLQVRLFARLAYAAEQVEQAVGLDPLPEPNLDEEGEGT